MKANPLEKSKFLLNELQSHLYRTTSKTSLLQNKENVGLSVDAQPFSTTRSAANLIMYSSTGEEDPFERFRVDFQKSVLTYRSHIQSDFETFNASCDQLQKRIRDSLAIQAHK